MIRKPKACLFVVDDNKALVDAIEAQFFYCGFEVVKAVDPKRALELSNQIKPDIVIADLRMPKLDGITFLKKFKEIQPAVKAIAMTGYYPEYETQMKDALHSGLVDRVIQKPFYAVELEKLVYELLKTPEDEIEFSRNAHGKLLIVDDEADVCHFLKEFFRAKNYSVAVAQSAEEALLVYQDFLPDVVITDIKMPDRDGIWLINEIRSKYQDAKFIVMTGQDTHVVLEQLKKETGIVDYFAKPFGLKEMEKLVAALHAMSSSKKY